MNNAVKTQPYSYHNFFFPFLWTDNSKSASRKKFIKCLSEHWKLENSSATALNVSDFIEKYNTYHYFNQAARNAIYSSGEKDSVVWNYRYDMSLNDGSHWLESPKTADNKAQYIITVNFSENDEDDNREYVLNVNGIRLKLFNTGIGILIFELENYNYTEIEDINKINDYGRRIYAPFCENIHTSCAKCKCLAENDNSSTCGYDRLLCFQSADSISLKYGTTKHVGCLIKKPTDYRETILIEPIRHLLTNGKYTITTNKQRATRTTFYIEPIIDDRMFTACYYINEAFINNARKWQGCDYAYICDATDNPLGQENDQKKKVSPKTYNFASMLYELIFVDGTGPTCQSRKLLKEKLGKTHIYDRWLEYGSITGISEYSMITVTNDTADYLARNFLTEYIELMVLALAQRASLLNFERMISNCALGKDNIRNIHKSFLLFQSQLLLQEVSPQQQGIELYQMLLDNMFIKKQTEDIEKLVTSLFTQKTSKNEANENLILFFIALLSTVEALWHVASYFLKDWGTLPRAGVVSGILTSLLALYFIYRKR